MSENIQLFTSLNKKLRFYKNAFVLCIFLNVLSVTFGVVFGAYYFNLVLSTSSAADQITFQINHTEKIDSQLNKIKDFLELKSKALTTRENMLEELTLWQELEGLLAQANQPAIDKKNLKNRETSIEYLSQLTNKNRETRAQLFTDWDGLRSKQNRPLLLFVVVAAITLFFGLFLPLYFLRQIALQIQKLKTDLHRAAQDITREWMHALTQFGDQPFKNLDFWLHIILLGASYLGKTSSHPGLQLASELARLIRVELQKNSSNIPADKVPTA